jgi:hypothetical protein
MSSAFVWPSFLGPRGSLLAFGLGVTRSEGPVGKSSDFLGDPPPDPRCLASLGGLSWVELHGL